MSNLVDLAEEQKSSFNYIEPEEAKARIPNYEPREGEEEDYTVEIPRHRRFQNLEEDPVRVSAAQLIPPREMDAP